MKNSAKMVSKEAFVNAAIANGYEVFDAKEIETFFSDNIQKSVTAAMTEEERKEFIVEYNFLQKAICQGEDGKTETVYYRQPQVEWEVAADGTVLKGIEGVYADTSENRSLARAGQAYIASDEVVKALLAGEDDFAAVIAEGVYADTPANRNLGRVGQPYMNAGK